MSGVILIRGAFVVSRGYALWIIRWRVVDPGTGRQAGLAGLAGCWLSSWQAGKAEERTEYGVRNAILNWW